MHSAADRKQQQPGLVDLAAAQQAASVVTSSAEEEVSSPFRMYLFGYMAAVLVAVLLQGESGHQVSLCISSEKQPLKHA